MGRTGKGEVRAGTKQTALIRASSRQQGTRRERGRDKEAHRTRKRSRGQRPRRAMVMYALARARDKGLGCIRVAGRPLGPGPGLRGDWRAGCACGVCRETPLANGLVVVGRDALPWVAAGFRGAQVEAEADGCRALCPPCPACPIFLFLWHHSGRCGRQAGRTAPPSGPAQQTDARNRYLPT